MATIKNVAHVGASGSLGEAVLNALIKSGKFNVTVVKRESSSATFPDGVTVRSADLSSVESVTEAFKGQDTVISTVGTEGLLGQSVLIEAAVAANVKRFLPSDFGADLANPKTAALPIFGYKIATHKVLRQAADTNSHFTYSLVVNGAFLDWGLKQNFLLNWNESQPKLFDGGNNPFSATTLDTVGQAVIGILTHPDETKNRFVYVKEINITQIQLLKIAKKIDPDKTWEEPLTVKTADIEKSSYESLAKGEITPLVLLGFLFLALFGPAEYGRELTKTDNELLGIKEKTVDDVEAVFRSVIQGGK